MTETMNIYQKLATIQKELLTKEIKKSGHNSFSNFDYHELKDFLPTIIELTYNYECTIIFDFAEEAVLTLQSWNDENDKISTSIEIPELIKLDRMNIVQSKGAYITYLKKYLLMDMFLILENDVVDSMDNTKKTNKGKPPVLETVIQFCQENYPDRKCDKKLLNSVSMRMMREKIITKDERKEVYGYLFPSK